MRVAVIDTETTGLVENRSMPLDRQPEVIEFYGISADLDKPKAKRKVCEVLIKPQRPIPDADEKGKKNIAKLTGITNAMVKDCDNFPSVAAEIISFIEASPVVIAQNASFDRDMLDIECERLGLSIRWPPLICTVEQSVHYLGRRLTLAELHEHLLGEKFPGAHRAKADTEALLRCCYAMRKRGDI